MSTDPSVDRIVSGATWNEFCDTLKMAGQTILRPGTPATPLDRAEGFRYLSRLTRAALEAFVEHNDPLAPVLHRPIHETAKIGADNPDNVYQFATISGEHEYRLFGTRGTIHYLGLGTYRGSYGAAGPSGETGYIEGRDLQVEPDGTFEVILSRKEHQGNWLRMAADTSSLIVRQTFLDRKRETMAGLSIERLGGDRTPTPVTPRAIDEGLVAASRLVLGTSALFANWVDDFKRHPNQLPRFDHGTSMAAHGDPNIVYYHSYYELEPDEALVVEVTPPECDYWNFQLNNYWMESLDYRYYTIAVNKLTAKYRSDGSVRIVVAASDPHVDNWLSTVGHRCGTMCWRWVRAKKHPTPATRVVRLAELR